LTLPLWQARLLQPLSTQFRFWHTLSLLLPSWEYKNCTLTHVGTLPAAFLRQAFCFGSAKTKTARRPTEWGAGLGCPQTRGAFAFYSVTSSLSFEG